MKALLGVIHAVCIAMAPTRADAQPHLSHKMPIPESHRICGEILEDASGLLLAIDDDRWPLLSGLRPRLLSTDYFLAAMQEKLDAAPLHGCLQTGIPVPSISCWQELAFDLFAYHPIGGSGVSIVSQAVPFIDPSEEQL